VATVTNPTLATSYPVEYTSHHVEVRQTEAFERWFGQLRDRRAKERIQARVRRLSLGHAGDTRPVGEGVLELRIHAGPGHRVYFVRRGALLVILLAGGDKGSQERDIARAKSLARRV